MNRKAKISIDLMGGENSPTKCLQGIDFFLNRNKNPDDCFFYLFGDKNLIGEKIKKYKFLKNNYELIDTKIVVSDDLPALSAIK